MSIKKCGVCKKDKPIDQFSRNPTKKDGRQYQCRDCQKKYRESHYKKNRQKYIDKAAKWRFEQKRKLYEYLNGKVCKDCGESDVIVLEFDHLRDKDFNIGQHVGYKSFKSIKEEIEKCDIVCANCHKRRTAIRLNNYRQKLLNASDA